MFFLSMPRKLKDQNSFFHCFDNKLLVCNKKSMRKIPTTTNSKPTELIAQKLQGFWLTLPMSFKGTERKIHVREQQTTLVPTQVKIKGYMFSRSDSLYCVSYLTIAKNLLKAFTTRCNQIVGASVIFLIHLGIQLLDPCRGGERSRSLSKKNPAGKGQGSLYTVRYH